MFLLPAIVDLTFLLNWSLLDQCHVPPGQSETRYLEPRSGQGSPDRPPEPGRLDLGLSWVHHEGGTA